MSESTEAEIEHVTDIIANQWWDVADAKSVVIDVIKALDSYRAKHRIVASYLEEVEVFPRFNGELEVANDYGMVEQSSSSVALYRLKDQERSNGK